MVTPLPFTGVTTPVNRQRRDVRDRDVPPLVVDGLGARWIAGEDCLVRSYLPGAGKPVAERNDPAHRRRLALASGRIGRATLPLLLQPSVRAETTIAADSSPPLRLNPRIRPRLHGGSIGLDPGLPLR